jgi:hypothetical protein
LVSGWLAGLRLAARWQDLVQLVHQAGWLAGGGIHATLAACRASLDAFHQAIAEFTVTDPGLVIEPAALAAARQSLDSSGLLLFGEVHGVREKPVLIWAFMQALELTTLALE